MALFQEWHLMNNIDNNISLIEKLLDNSYYYLNDIDSDDLIEKLNQFIEFKILLEIRDEKFKEKEMIYKNNIKNLKRKLNSQNDYIHLIYLYSIITIFFISTIYFYHFYFYRLFFC